MKLDEFIDENGISVFVKADIRTKQFEVIKTDIKHETYNLFQQLILYNSVDNLFESVKGQMLPRIWSQGKTKCVICQINEEQLVVIFYDTTMDVKDNYLFAKQLEIKVRELFLQ
mgnify:CR=1 FL=1